MLKRIDEEKGIQSAILNEIRDVDVEYTEAEKAENIPLLLAVTNDKINFKLAFNNKLEYAAQYPILPIVLSMLEEIRILRYCFSNKCRI